jgi:hypothetical protein
MLIPNVTATEALAEYLRNASYPNFKNLVIVLHQFPDTAEALVEIVRDDVCGIGRHVSNALADALREGLM